MLAHRCSLAYACTYSHTKCTPTLTIAGPSCSTQRVHALGWPQSPLIGFVLCKTRMSVEPRSGTPLAELPLHRSRLTSVLSPPRKFTLGLMARATQIEDRSPLPDLQRPLSPGGNREIIRAGAWRSVQGRRAPEGGLTCALQTQ